MSSHKVAINVANNSNDIYSGSIPGDLLFYNEAPGSGFAFCVNSNPIMTIGTSNSVIYSRFTGFGGKSNPSYPIDVAGNINFTGILRKEGNPLTLSQWGNSGSNVFILNSNVGIGTSNPQYLLDVNGIGNFSNVLVNGQSITAEIGADLSNVIYTTSNTVFTSLPTIGGNVTGELTINTLNASVNLFENELPVDVAYAPIEYSNIAFQMSNIVASNSNALRSESGSNSIFSTSNKAFTDLSLEGGTLTGTLNGTIINATTQLSQSGSAIVDLFAQSGVSNVAYNALQKSGGVINGNLSITGDLTVNGTSTLFNSSNVLIEDNLVTLNKNQTGIPDGGLLSGIEVERGSASNYLFVYQESSGLFKVGLSNDLQAVMTRNDTMISGYPYYDTASYKLVNKAIEISDVDGLSNVLGGISTAIGAVNQRVTDNLSSSDPKLTVDSNINMPVNKDWNVARSKEVFFPTQTIAITTSGLNTTATSVALDSVANFYVAGTYGISNDVRVVPTIYNSNGAVSSLSLPNTSALSNINNRAAFVVCYNSNAVGQYDVAVDGVGNDSITSIAVDSGRNLLVCGSYSNRSPILFNSTGLAANLPQLPGPSNTAAFIVKYNSNGSALWTSSIDGANSDSANSIKTDTVDNVIVAGVINGGADIVRIHQMVQQDVEGYSSPTGLSDVSVFTGMGGATYVNGLGTLAGFNGPRGVASDGTNFYIADAGNHRIRKISPGGLVTLIAGSGAAGFSDAIGTNAQFNQPFGVAVDTTRNVLYVTERTHRVRRIDLTNNQVTSFAGSGVSGGADNVGTLATFNDPNGVAIDSSGNVYVVECTGNKIRRIDVNTRQVTTLAGSGVTGGTNATGTNASFNAPIHIAIDSNNIAYVAEYGGHRVRRIDLSTRAVTLLAGSGVAGFTNGTGAGAGFNAPTGVAVDSNFNVYVTEHGNHTIRRITPGGVVTTIAGTGQGYVNAIGTSAQFLWPDGMAFDANYGLYVADLGNHRIRRVEFPGVYTQVFAGNGNSANVNGKATISGFANPAGTGFDSKGNMYVACLGDHRIKRITVNGDVSVFAGSGAASFADGLGTAAAFNTPHGLVVDMYDNVYVCDFGNLRIRKITPDGMVSTIAGTGIAGSTDGVGTNASFNNPWGITVDSAGNLYVVGQGSHNVRRITPNLVVTTIAGTGNTGILDGLGTAAGFNTPNAICCDRDGNLYVSDRTNYKIRRITPSGVVSTFAGSTNGGSGNVDGLGTNARFGIIRGIAIDKYNNLYVGDITNFNIRKIDPSGRVSTIAGTGASGAVDGYNRSASFTDIYYLTIDNSGNIYVSDGNANTIRILSTSKEITTFAGSGTATLLNGDRLVAGFNRPHYIAMTSNGDMYVSEYVNNTIRKIDGSTGIVTTFAGSGLTGSTDGVGTNASFNGPVGVAFDSNGNLYVADTGNRIIRRITPDGTVSTFAGSGANGTLDGTGTNASFSFPSGLVFDTDGNLFVSDQGNTRIRKITPEGVVSTFAITGQIESAGIAFDSSGNLYVADLKSHVISKITPSAVVSTFAGTAGSTGTVDGLGTNARFNVPFGLSVDKYDNIYVADKNNNIIRKITQQGRVTTLFGNGTSTFANGYGLNCSFVGPHGIYVYGNDIYIMDTNGHRIRKTNVYSAFSYENTMTVSSNASFPSAGVLGGAAIAAVKYNSGGNPQWAVAVDGAANDRGTSVNVDSSGNIYLAGNYGQATANVYKNASVIASLPATTSALGAAVGVKLNSNGDFQWAVRVDGNCSNVACHVDSAANLYLCGSYSNSGALVINATNSNVGSLPSVTSNSAFLVKYTSNGDLAWARTIVGNNVNAYGVVADNLQNVFLCGSFAGPNRPTIYSSNNENSSVNMITPNGSNMMSYMVEYNSNGIPLQAYNMMSTSNNMAYSIATDTWGSNIYIGGSYQGTATVYDGNGNVSTLSSSNVGLPIASNESMYVTRHVAGSTPFYLAASLGADDVGKQKFVTNIGSSNIIVNLTSSNNQNVLSSAGVINPGSNAIFNWLNPVWRRIV